MVLRVFPKAGQKSQATTERKIMSKQLEDTYPLPEGGTTTDVNESLAAWKGLAEIFRERCGFKLVGFDPDIEFEFQGIVFTLPLKVALELAVKLTRPKAAQEMYDLALYSSDPYMILTYRSLVSESISEEAHEAFYDCMGDDMFNADEITLRTCLLIAAESRS
jgi:hypothetical protein